MALKHLVRIALPLLLTGGLSVATHAQSDARDQQKRTTPSAKPGTGVKPESVAPSTPAPAPPPATPAQPREATIMPRDTLNIVVLDQPGFSSKYLVGLDGTFDYPYIGRVKAAGLTVRQVGDELKSKLVPNYLVNPQISIDLEQILNKRVTVTGEVRAPSEYPFAGEITLLTALTKAGSVSDNASEQALVFRAGSTSGIPVNLQELLSGQLSNNLVLQDGDTVLVLKAEPVYVTGEIRSPGQFAVRPGMTVQQAIALAGGLTDKGKYSDIKIQRKAPTTKNPNEKKEIKVKDYKIEIVKPGDTVIVPRRIV